MKRLLFRNSKSSEVATEEVQAENVVKPEEVIVEQLIEEVLAEDLIEEAQVELVKGEATAAAKWIAERAKALGADDVLPDTPDFNQALKEVERGAAEAEFMLQQKEIMELVIIRKNQSRLDSIAEVDALAAMEDKRLARVSETEPKERTGSVG